MRLNLYWALLVLVMLTQWASRAFAGPPLFADDPHTIEAGSVEVVLGAKSLEQGDSIFVTAPISDLTLGVAEGLEVSLLASPVFEIPEHRGSTDTSDLIEAGFKWQLIESEAWNASFAPTFSSSEGSDSRVGFVLPVQVEWSHRELSFGLDAGYIAQIKGSDGWQANAYAVWQPTSTLALVAEVWSQGLAQDDPDDVGLNAGFEWTTPLGFDVLLAGGTGIATWGGPRVEWTSYAGLRWTFGVW